ncbi:hypothetical protein [Paraurantiacibacter namhicola]|nr:hypothetical protein [Paraurantiacibacter namhicola]
MASPEADEAAPAADPIRTLLGQWEVEQVAGDAPQYTRMLLVFGEDWWHMQSQCVYDTGDYRIAGDTLDFAPIARAFPAIEGKDGPIMAMCARGLSPAEEALPQVLSASREFTIREDGRLAISTPSGPLVARRVEETVANPQGYTQWDPATTFGEWRIVSLDGEPVADVELVVAGLRTTIRTGCAYYQWIWYSDMMSPSKAVRREPFRTGCDEPESAQAAQLAKAYETLERYSADGPDRRVLSGPGGIIVLARPAQ